MHHERCLGCGEKFKGPKPIDNITKCPICGGILTKADEAIFVGPFGGKDAGQKIALTKEAILAEPAGPRMNEWIGECFRMNKEFVCPRCRGTCFGAGGEDYTELDCHGCGWKGTWDEIRWQRFSEENSLAWGLIEELADAGYLVHIQNCCRPEAEWCVIASKNPEGPNYDAAGPLALAACQAALMAATHKEGT